MKEIIRHTLLLALTLASTAAGALELDDYRLVDLTHAYNAETIYWPTSPSKFERVTLAEGHTGGGWYYSAYSICTPEHGGTHLDAPVHFAENGATTDELPLRSLIAPAVVIDVSAQADADRNYRLSVDDVLKFESEFGRIEEGTIVLLKTGWSKHWPDVREYLGDDTPGDASKLSFPSFGADAGRLLVEERGVAMLGVDTASIDYGSSKDFPVHRIAGPRNVAGLENLTNLEELPPVGFTLIALPMKIEGGSGGPVRIVALVPK
jgi:kynurenine formamidase